MCAILVEKRADAINLIKLKYKEMKNTLLKFLQKYDKSLKSSYIKDYLNYTNKDEVYLDCGGKNIDYLISSLGLDFDIKEPIINLSENFCVYSFYVPDSFEWLQNIYNVETKINIIGRNKKNVYHSYLNTKDWYKIRNKALKNADYKCSKCGCTENLQVHHLNYDTIGNESIGDLFVCCKCCHSYFHNI